MKILIVDDEPDISFFLSRTLHKMNFETLVAIDLKSARTLIETEFPEIILLDNHLPDGFGIDFSETIKQIIPHSKIIMITAHDSSQDRIKAFKNGVDYFVSKPFTIDHIVSLVESISTNGN